MADPVILSKEKLIELYIDERKSAAEISEMLFCSHTTVLKNMKSYNIERRKTGEAISLKYNLKAEYIKEMLNTKTQEEIAEHYGCNKTTIHYAIKRFKERGEW